jgi:flagellar motor switch protein FliG
MMTPSQKAAAILALAGEENASKLVRNIPEYEVKKILRSFSRLPTLTEQDIDNIAKEFLEIIKNLDLDSNKFSMENAKRILYTANNSMKDSNWIESISDSFLIDEIRNILNEIDERILSNWLKNELPQTMSLVLSICLPEKSSSLFKNLQEYLRCEIILRISQMNHVDTPELENLYEELEKLQKNRDPIQTNAGGFEKILSVLQASPFEQREKLMEGIELRDPELAKKLMHALLSVSRLAELDPTHLSLLCSNLSDKILSLAMRIEQAEIRNKFLSSLSKKRRHLIEEDMSGNKQLKKDAEIASSLIVKKALELKDSGKIVFPWEVTLV